MKSVKELKRVNPASECGMARSVVMVNGATLVARYSAEGAATDDERGCAHC
jgi:hypothetical protein